MSQLRSEFHKFRDFTGIPIVKIAEHTHIDVQKLYRFSSGDGDLRNDDAVNLHQYLSKSEMKSYEK